jgi:hypothetical protein
MTLPPLEDRIARFIDACANGLTDHPTRDALLAELSALQAKQVEPYRRYLAAEPRRPRAFALPALPTDVFRFTRVASHSALHDIKTFHTSGTTDELRGAHAFRDLTLYDRAARAAAAYALFPKPTRATLCILAPRECELPDSSLSYMLARFCDWFGSPASSYAWRDGRLDVAALTAALQHAELHDEPLALLGTSFAFVHADEALAQQRFRLPAGSRIMQTGGFKGRSRTLDPAQMLALLGQRYGVDASYIVQEYGMTELSSQLYETPLRAACLGLPPTARRLWVPGWLRAEPIDPETLEPVGADEVGLLRIDDLANLGSVCAIQTSDLARRCADGVIVLGRAADAVARGCSLAVDHWLGGPDAHA